MILSVSHATGLVGTLVLLALAPGRLQAQDHPAGAHSEHVHGLGTVTFPNSGALTAQASFLRGVALLHSFEYVDAADAFREAQEADPGFALAYWAEAFTYRRPLWGSEDLRAARGALMRLGPTAAQRLAKAPNPRERAYGAAVEALFADVEEGARARAFADSMRRLMAEYPDDTEATAFTALAILGAVRWLPRAEQEAAILEAAALAERVFRANPNHPGAAHYMIHAYDDPAVAAQGLEAARAYAKIAPEAVHALHMPSHIFVQIGQWDDAAASNERAWAASRAWVTRRGAPNVASNWHSLHWLEYAYLQQGRFREARVLIDSAQTLLAGADFRNASNLDGIFAVPQMEFLYALETGDWGTGPVVDTTPDLSQFGALGGSIRSQGYSRNAEYWRAVTAAMRGDSRNAEGLARRFRALSDSLQAEGVAASWYDFAAAQLNALAARTRGEHEQAIALLREAASHEEHLAPLGPPMDWPAHELLGTILLEAGRRKEALAAFERALARRPNRSAALLGIARARAALGEEAAAGEAYRRLLANWTRADSDLAALAEGRRAVAKP